MLFFNWSDKMISIRSLLFKFFIIADVLGSLGFDNEGGEYIVLVKAGDQISQLSLGSDFFPKCWIVEVVFKRCVATLARG